MEGIESLWVVRNSLNPFIGNFCTPKTQVLASEPYCLRKATRKFLSQSSKNFRGVGLVW